MPPAHRGCLAIVAVLTFAYLLSYPLAIGRADESHLLYGARRVLEGQVIYDDFWEVITPLSFYLFAGIYWLGGTTLLAARVGIALFEVVGCVLLFALVRRIAGLAEAVIAALIYIGVCVPTWPYASAHWMSTTLALVVATLTLDDGWQRSSRLRPLVAGLFTGIALCVQQQRGAFVAVWLFSALAVLSVSRPRGTRWRTLWTELAFAGGGAAIVTLIVLGHAAWASSPAQVIEAIYGFAVKRYAPTHAGASPWAGVFPLADGWVPYTWLWLLRVSPLFLVGEAVALLGSIRRPWAPPDLLRICLWLLGVWMALSVWYLPDFIHVSFVLPFLLIPGLRVLHGLRAWRARLPVARHLSAVAVWAFVLVLVWKSATNLAHAHEAAPVRFETAFGTLRSDAFTAQLFRTVSAHLVREPGGRRLLYSYPDDAWLYLTLPADDATRFSMLLAGFFPPEYIEQAIDVLRARRPGTVVLAFETPAIRDVVQQGYDMVEELKWYRIFVRRDSPAPETAGPLPASG